jgi:deoxyribodipyrimidine photo-lyase
MIVLFIFRRDLRTFDNTTLNFVKTKYPNASILPVFIFNKYQIDEKNNKYYSKNSVQFLFESLSDLNKNLEELNFYYTDNEIDIINKINKKNKLIAIACNKDYTPYAKKRDADIEKYAKENKIDFVSKEDYTLHDIGTILKDNNKPYLKYTPFYKKSILKIPNSINSNTKFKFIKDSSSFTLKQMEDKLKPKENKNIFVNGGRKNALLIIAKLKSGYHNKYDTEREYPFLNKTTKLSAYIKYGCVSIREIYFALPIKHGIVRELFWHDFYAIITYYFPYIFQKSFLLKYEKVKWDYNETNLNKWKAGLTGFPIIDAAMRQLNETGWMHNRCRMIVASFLTKNLFMYWKYGEQYFASKLVDYDPSSNNGGWQWCASTGTDCQPYFRIFSPSAQLKKYDKDCQYVKKWIPELRDVSNKVILNWETKNNININYPKPIVDIKETSKLFIKRFKEF